MLQAGFFFFQAEDGIRDHCVTGVQTCALPILSSTLRAGTEPGRVYLGLLEAARVAECLPQGLLATERNRATNSTSHAPPSATDHRLLEAIFFMARIALYYARVSKFTGSTSIGDS